MFPRLLTVGSYALHTYGLLVALGFLTGVWLASRLAPKAGLDPEQVFGLGVYTALVAIVGAKLLMIATDLSYYREHPAEIFSLQSLQSGGVFYGGFVAGLAFVIAYCLVERLSFLGVADTFAPGLALGHAIGRVGCFSAGCCWGRQTQLPWAVVFTNPYSHELTGVPLGIPLHPTQLYESAALLVIFLLLLRVHARSRFAGQVFAAYLMLYAAARFGLEFLRGDPDRGFVLGGALSTSQFLGIFLFVGALIFYLFRRRRADEHTHSHI